MEEEKKNNQAGFKPMLVLIGVWAVLGIILTVAIKAIEPEFLSHYSALSTAWAVPNFLILCTVLYWLMFKNTPDALPMLNMKMRLRNRREKIANALQGAESSLSKAEALHKDYSERLDSMEREIAGLKDMIRKEGEFERKRILDEAEKQTQRIKNEAEFTAKQELRMARARLKQEAVDRAVEMAEEILSRTMTDEDRTRLMNEFLEKMEKSA